MQELMQPIGTPDGLFHDGNPATGDLGTIVSALWLNALQGATRSVQSELLSVLTAAGIAIDPAKSNQVLDSIKKIAWGTTQARPTTLAGYGITDAIPSSDKGAAGGVATLDQNGFVSESQLAIGALPLAALPFPTIDTADNRIGVTSAAVAGVGGTVSVPAGVMIGLAKEVTAGKTGRQGAYTTAAWTSANLDINSTYYLRAQVVNGVLTFYVQKGTDADTIPASQKGTVNGANGGGFDSTVIDMLVAKVVTGAAGTVPALTTLANAAALKVRSIAYDTITRTSVTYTVCGKRTTDLTLNWARTPTFHMASFDYLVNGSLAHPEDMQAYYTGSVTDASGTLTAVVNRYIYAPVGKMDTNLGANTAIQFSPLASDFLVMA